MVSAVDNLEAEMQRCVAAMKFEEAAQLRDRLRVLKAGVEAKVSALEAQLQKHVAALEFEAAAKLRDEIKSLRGDSISGVDGTGAAESEKEERKRQRDERNSRTVYVCRLPLEVSKAEVNTLFPTAKEITLRQGKNSAYAFVTFPTVKEAQSIVAGKAELAGRRIEVRMADDKKEAENVREEQDSRTAVLRNLPLTASQAELRRLFPTAQEVNVVPGKSKAVAFVVFKTNEHAQSAVSQVRPELDGCTISMASKKGGKEPESRKKEEQSRTVFIGALPLTTTQAELEQSFPTAERIVLHPGKMQAFAFVVFSTVEVATKIASQGKMEVAGHPVYLDLCMAGNKEAAESRRKKEQSRTLFIGPMPLAATQAELEQRFPTAEHISIHREKLHSRAIVIFSTEEEARSVASQTKVELAGHNIDLCMRDNKERWLAIQNERTARTVVMSRLPTTVCEATLNQRYPTAEAINLVQTGPRAIAFVCFPTAEEAVAMASQATVIIDGQTVALRMAVSREALGQKRAPPAATANAKRQKR